MPDDESIMISLEAIAQWAQGFLMGLSLSGVNDFSSYAEDVEEFVETMVSVSDADRYDLADDESDEEADQGLDEWESTLSSHDQITP